MRKDVTLRFTVSAIAVVTLAAPGCHDTQAVDICDLACGDNGTCVYHEDPDRVCECDDGYELRGIQCVHVAADGDADVDADLDDADIDEPDVDADQEQEVCTSGDSQSCGATNIGVCEYGTQACVDGVWGECEGAVGPGDELCDGERLDEDCDGSTNEDCPCSESETMDCGTDVGVCEFGVQTCSAEGVWGACEGGFGPGDEVCDAEMLDENCSGASNEGCLCVNGEDRPCGSTDLGVCAFGTQTCVEGAFAACEGAIEPGSEICDAELLDENCDGRGNEGCACVDDETQGCGSDVGRCEAGLMTCRDGEWSGCEDVTEPIAESCDGIDEDCDNVVDNGPNACGGVCELAHAPGTLCDGADADICADDTYVCDGRNATVCSLGSANVEVCNRGDDDCDGTTDEDCAPPPVTTARFPWNGYATGSVHAAGALRPSFRWETVVAATDYQLQVDDSCTTPGFATCAFASPEIDVIVPATSFRPLDALPVSVVQPVGRRYYWRVRSCTGTACSSWTTIRYADVGRQTQDYDGDGYADVIVGANHQDNPEDSEGAVYAYRSSGTAIPSTVTTTLDNPGDQVNGQFGAVVDFAGDVNADGFADVIIGALNQDNPETDEGAAYVFLGSAAGLPSAPTTTIDCPGDQASAVFGFAVASAGDVNGDGFADVIVGASMYDSPESGEGNAFVFHGAAAGVSTTPAATLDNPADQAGGMFGGSVASAGDVNGDGYVDVIVAAIWQDNPESNEGNAFVFHGSSSGISAVPATTIDNPADQASAYLGRVASAGDVNGDGFADVVVGVSSQDNPESNEGVVFVFHGTASGIPSAPTLIIDNPLDQASGAFSEVAPAGDVNGDGFADVLVGANGQDSPEANEGVAYVFHGSAGGLPATPSTTIDNPADQASGLFGSSVASAGDVNGDGFADVIVGASYQDNPEDAEGNAFVFHGAAGGLVVTPATTLDNPADQAGGSFGESVASADHRRPDGRQPMLVHRFEAGCLPRRFGWC